MQFNKALSYNVILKTINVIVLFFINLILVRIIGANITGDFFYLITVLSFLTLVVSLSLEAGIIFYASKNIAGTVSFAWLIILVSVFQFVVTALIILFLVNNPTSLPLYYLIFFVISNILVSNFTALFISKKWFFSVNIAILVVNLITFFFLLLVSVQNDIDAISTAEKIYIVSFIIQAAVLITLFFIKTRSYSWKLPSFDILKKLFSYSMVVLIGNISFFLVTRLDYVFVKAFCTSEALGNYVQVSKVGQMFILIPTMAASVIFPFAASSNENILSKVQGLCRLMTMIIIAGSIFIILTGKWLFPWFFGEDFNLMYTALLFYLPGIFSLCISSLLASYISGKGFIGINVMASGIALMLVIIGDIIFIPEYGINAAAAVSSMAYLACMMVLLRHCIIKYDSRLSDFFSIRFTGIRSIFNITDKNKS